MSIIFISTTDNITEAGILIEEFKTAKSPSKQHQIFNCKMFASQIVENPACYLLIMIFCQTIMCYLNCLRLI